MNRPTKRVLDTSVLCHFWRGFQRQTLDTDTVREKANELIARENTRWIVSPVRIEFLVGARSSAELQLYEDFLAAFDVIDGGKIPPQDWQEAERLAKRIGAHRQRKLGDCLIEAIANRLHCEVVTKDPDFQRRYPPQID